METLYDMLRAQPFVAGLTEHQLDRLSLYAHRSMFHAGNRLFREGYPADRFWLIEHGRVTIDTHVPGRGDVVIDTLGDGAVLGWSWLFPPHRWHFGAIATVTTVCVQLDAGAVRALCDRDPALGYDLANRFMQVMLDRLQATRRRLVELDAIGR